MNYTPAFYEAYNTLMPIEGRVFAPIDGGTYCGITQKLSDHYYPGRDVSSLTEAEIVNIYWTEFWSPMRLERIATVSPKIAYKLFQWGVNGGISIPSKALQSSLNCVQKPYNLTVDGILGSQTLAAVVDYVGKGKESILYKMLNCRQGMFYMNLMDYGDVEGWFVKRIT